MNVGHTPEKPGFACRPRRRKPQNREEPPAKPARRSSHAGGGGEDVVALLAKANRGERQGDFQEMPRLATSPRKARRRRSGPTSGASSTAQKRLIQASNYSEAMKAKGGDWSFDGTRRIFCTARRPIFPARKWCSPVCRPPSDEADVIAYLATLADTPVPLPK